jgi:hypothetical protein
MPDALTTDQELDRLQAAVRACANDILAGFEREKISHNVALAICGAVLARLLDRSTPAIRAEFIAALQARHDA